MPQKCAAIEYNYIVALSIRRVDLRVDEVQGVISQVDLSGGSMKGSSLLAYRVTSC